MSGPLSSSGKATRAFEDACPPLEGGGGRSSQPRVQRERLGDGAHGARRRHLDPRQLLRGAQRLQLFLEPLLRDRAARDVEDAGGVVDDERAEGGAAEAALEEHPDRARAGAVDPREPRAPGLLRPPRDDGPARGLGGHSDTLLREPVERAPGGAAHVARRLVRGEGREDGQRGRAVRRREVAQRGFERRRGGGGERLAGDGVEPRRIGQRRLEDGAAGCGIRHTRKGREGPAPKWTRRV